MINAVRFTHDVQTDKYWIYLYPGGGVRKLGTFYGTGILSNSDEFLIIRGDRCQKSGHRGRRPTSRSSFNIIKLNIEAVGQLTYDLYV